MTDDKKKIAVVMLNLGGPDSLDAVKPFLQNLFSDPAIIGLPALLRLPLARFIASKRAPKAQEIYAQMSGRSPILPNTQRQADALQALLADAYDARVFICMRYWHPMSDEVASQVKKYDPQEIILLPLYPHYSTTTTASSIREWHRVCRKIGLSKKTHEICCYPTQEKMVQAQAELMRQTLLRAQNPERVRVLFSAHGLPEKVIQKGDPYQWQIEQNTKAILAQLGGAHDWINCYQSRVGPLKWIGPSTEDEIRRAADEGMGVMIVPIAFVSEHSETLVELDIEYKHLAQESGVTEYLRVPTLSAHPLYVQALAKLCDEALLGAQQQRMCPADKTQCPCAQP